MTNEYSDYIKSSHSEYVEQLEKENCELHGQIKKLEERIRALSVAHARQLEQVRQAAREFCDIVVNKG